MIAQIHSGAVLGIDGYHVEVEVNLSQGLPSMSIVGLPDAAVKESSDRVEAAIKNTRLEMPLKRIVVNMAPANIKKEGSSFDLPIALGILAASGILKKDLLHSHLVLGELSLDGRIKPVRGALSIATMAKEKGLKGMLVPAENAGEAAVVEGINVYPVENLPMALEFLNGTLHIKPKTVDIQKEFLGRSSYELDFTDVKGQHHVKRALEIAASGGHNIMMLYIIKYYNRMN